MKAHVAPASGDGRDSALRSPGVSGEKSCWFVPETRGPALCTEGLEFHSGAQRCLPPSSLAAECRAHPLNVSLRSSAQGSRESLAREFTPWAWRGSSPRGGEALASAPRIRSAHVALPAGVRPSPPLRGLRSPRPGPAGRGVGRGGRAGRGAGGPRFPPPGGAPQRCGPARAGGAGKLLASPGAAEVQLRRVARSILSSWSPPARPPVLLPVPGVTSLCSAF